jgi:hypothetical protein
MVKSLHDARRKSSRRRVADRSPTGTARSPTKHGSRRRAPPAVAQDHDRVSAGRFILLVLNEPAQCRAEPEDGEVVARHHLAPNQVRLCPSAETNGCAVLASESGKDASLVSELELIQVRRPCNTATPVIDLEQRHERLAVRHRKPTDHQAVHDREHE